MPTIALIGDFDPSVTAHRGILRSLELIRDAELPSLTWAWVETRELTGDVPARLADAGAVWCVPASPYANTQGALDAIRFARESSRPFLGTCGGFQHALLEYARNVWRIDDGAHAELDPNAAHPVVAPLSCSLVEVAGTIRPEPGSRLASIYGAPEAVEGYHCSYGLAPEYAGRLESGPLRVGARDAEGDIRAIELIDHPFYIATLYQPERAALNGRAHPLIAAFAGAAADA